MTVHPASRVLTADGNWMADGWHVLREGGAFDPAQATLLPLGAYLHEAPGDSLGVWLAPDDDARALRERIGRVPLVAIEFPKFADGRGYSLATRLRTQLKYAGELRALGEILVDQLFMLRRVGFSSFALRADQSLAAARAALGRYSDAYQTASDATLPAFRRRAAPFN
jgi:uncharacterized protein (DUF934 family)